MDNCCICGSPSGYIGCWNGNDFVWFCGKHEHLGKPVPPKNGRFEAPEDHSEFERFLKSGLTYDWLTRMVGYIRYEVKEGEEDSGETWQMRARKWIGDPPSSHTIGAAILRASKEGLLEKTGRTIAPRGAKSHGSQKPEWRRTAVK